MTVTHKQAKGSDTVPFAISLRGVEKTFGAVCANHNIDLDICTGDIHGIIGENGAGKSTLVSILYGFYRADAGTIRVFGKERTLRSTADAIAAGIGMVHQHFMLVPTFTVLENIILGHEGTESLAKGFEAARVELAQLAARYGLDVDLDAVIEDFPVGLQQRVEILKALYRGANILILDEPTGVLTPQETDQLFDILRALKEQGVTILLITHKLREIMAITDHVSVMRGGEMVAHKRRSDTTPEELAEIMVGRPVRTDGIWHPPSPAQVVLRADNLGLNAETSEDSAVLVSEISFALKAGEILGVAGVSGNGQSELLELLAGIRAPSSGSIQIGERHITAEIPSSPSEIKSLSIAHVPEDRHLTGLILSFSAAESMVLGYEEKIAGGMAGWLDREQLGEHCASLMRDFDVRPPDPSLKSSLFSGGNQQKIVLAREMSAAPSILLVGQATRGVDIGSIEFIHKQLIAMRDKGCAIILVSVELDEILTLSDRIMVMNNGSSMGIVERKEADARSIGLLMAGVR